MSTSSTPPTQGVPGQDPSLGTLVSDFTTRLPELIRSEIRLAQAEMAQKGKAAGMGIGMFSAAGLFALYGLAALFATIILLLTELAGLDGWLSALIVTVALFVIAGIAALVGKSKVQQAGPPKPERAIEGIQTDIATVKGGNQ